MKTKKKNESQRVTELGEHILKTQNTMLAAKIDQLKKEIQNMKSFLVARIDRDRADLIGGIITLQKTERIRIIMAYNEEAIQKKVAQEDIQDEKFECLCGANQIDSIKYFLVNGHPQILQQQQQEIQQPEENNQQTQSNQKDYIKKLIQESSEEKAQLLHQIEELKLQQKLPEEQFFQTQLFAELVQQNNYLTTTLFNIEEQLIQVQLANKDLLEKSQQQIQQCQLECEQKIRELFSQQDIIKIEVKQNDDQTQNTLIEELKSQVEHSSKMIEDLKIELQQCRERNKEAHNQLGEIINQKQTLLNQNNELKQYISVHKILSKDEKIEQVTLRYEKHKQLLYEIEQEYANTKSNEFIQRFREFVGYVKMRDEKVKGLEQQLEAKINDCNNIKKQIQQLIDELDYNSNSFNSINETNKNLSKLVNETQKNLSRAMQEKVDERIKFETERQQFQQKIQTADETIKQLQSQNDQQKKLLNLFDNERMIYKESIRNLQKSDGESQQKLLQKEWDVGKILEENKIIQEREKLSESINLKFIKKAEKSKSKLKYLKLQMKLESKDTDNELLTSLKMMVDCQQCKKRVKQVILMKCLHMFCKPCIDDNQKNRNRACPVCRAKYGIEEVKAIILN